LIHAVRIVTMSDASVPRTLLSFFLGPVQGFISAARSVRDLWTGSYLLSYLTFRAMEPIIRRYGIAAFVTPELTNNPLVEWLVNRQPQRPEQLITPCLPNTFIALVPAGGRETDELAQDCERNCRDAWRAICADVRATLQKKVTDARAAFRVTLAGKEVDLAPGWDKLWGKGEGTDGLEDQVGSYFEIHTVVMPEGSPREKRRLLSEPPDSDWLVEMDVLGRMMAARKSVRHVPAYRATGDVPQKCSMLGSYEQMGPAKFAESKAFWEGFAKNVQLAGTRTRKSERLCAVSLVKRYAWAAHLCKQDVLNLNPQKLRYSDTATVAAKRWLPPPEVVPDDWNGQWLHWTRRNQEDDEPACPPKVWEFIQARKKTHSKPPTYYAILILDSDRIGELLREAASQERSLAVSAALTSFALNDVPHKVEHWSGELIYSGGDDLLALLPAETVVSCATEIRSAYMDNWTTRVGGKATVSREGKENKLGASNWTTRVGGKATVSAGIAVVHIKEDLRFALEMARKAEKKAKDAGRDALAMTVCRRSGEHTTTVIGWDQADAFISLVKAFRDGASDRWAYQLRGELPTLQGEKLPPEARAGELLRILRRAEGTTADFQTMVERLLSAYLKEMLGRGHTPGQVFAEFVTVCQSAAFLARGRD